MTRFRMITAATFILLLAGLGLILMAVGWMVRECATGLARLSDVAADWGSR